ncbi:ribonuclease-III-like-domain-containing protein [Pseudoneurospora amorphoporcata]|uniref:Ribonuclease-III-like-domain-containing protein n=1 Tax=Pseudoneurospora amorphoporcata TaxID=241081 RepID=A0AAN6SJ09_9PEZI|nr:ribonuclease-III-like-domain-containing protein [Pseudoneurospora amorphoporcata]
MAALTPSRSVFASTCKTVAQQCSRRPAAVQQLAAVPVARQVSSSSAVQQEQDASGSSQQPRPRWSYTPERMRGPGFSLNLVKDPRRKQWMVNSDPTKLDAFYEAFLGQGGARMLSDETKWLAVTHKSFDYGRRGYNTRLAFLGRQIIALEATRSILTSPVLDKPIVDKYGRQPYSHAALANIDKLIYTQPIDIMDKTKLARMGVDLGLLTVMRWKPRMPEDLESSGVVVVLNSTLFAIIGAISLEKGGAVAQRIVREKILKKLGA